MTSNEDKFLEGKTCTSDNLVDKQVINVTKICDR